MPSLSYNQVQQISSHNSYDGNGPKNNIEVQFEMGVRSFELDLHTSAVPGNWDIYHFVPPADFVADLKNGLAILKSLHDSKTDHEVVTVWLELKDDWEETGHMPVDLDNCIAEGLPNLIYHPADLRSAAPGASNLREVVNLKGWPTLESLESKFIFVLMGNDAAVEQYLTDMGNNGLCFAAPEDDLLEKLNPGIGGGRWLDSIFFNCHNNDGEATPREVHHCGFVSRIWRVDDQEEYAFAINSKAHHIATDHVTRDLFLPRLVDARGNPFRPFDHYLVDTNAGSSPLIEAKKGSDFSGREK
jgi:hypothetical protein